MRLLIVEDNGEMRRLLKRSLAGLATEIYECDDGAQALALYSQTRPDWVLMDIELGDVDGITATKLIRALDPAAQIIIVTNYDEAELREAAQSAGARSYLLKENLLDLSRLLQAAEAPAAPPVQQRDGSDS